MIEMFSRTGLSISAGPTFLQVAARIHIRPQVFFSFHPRTFDSSIAHLQTALKQISSWMSANLLTIRSLPLLSTLSLNTVTLSLYYNLLKSQINRLQHIQNCLARTVVKAPKSSHITPILRSLHWLKMNERIEYKCVLLFCACCYFVVYICTWTLFSLYARPYVFTFYV